MCYKGKYQLGSLWLRKPSLEWGGRWKGRLELWYRREMVRWWVVKFDTGNVSRSQIFAWNIPIIKWCPNALSQTFSHGKKQSMTVSYVSRSSLLNLPCLTNAILGKGPMQIFHSQIVLLPKLLAKTSILWKWPKGCY